MGVEQSLKMCKSCGKHTMVQRPGANHILHLLLTLFTMGFWLIIWILVAVRFGGWRCSVCGKAV